MHESHHQTREWEKGVREQLEIIKNATEKERKQIREEWAGDILLILRIITILTSVAAIIISVLKG